LNKVTHLNKIHILCHVLIFLYEDPFLRNSTQFNFGFM